MTAGGSNTGPNDAGHFAFESRKGDFDVRARIARLDRMANKTKAMLMAREFTNANSRAVWVGAYPTNGDNAVWCFYKPSAGTDYVVWAGGVSSTAGSAIPNQWIRLQRQGDVFTGYRSTNGLDWVQMARMTNSLPANILLGLAATAQNNSAGQATTAWFQNYGDYGPSLLTQPVDQSIASGSQAEFGVTARGLAPLSYQWYHDGVPDPRRDQHPADVNRSQTADVGDYVVVVSNTIGSVSSQPATLDVDGVGRGGLEADVAPSPLGDATITMQDWVKSGLFVAGLESPVNSFQFQRADCAPAPCGDARMTVADWTQAGRYAAALDDPIQACGPENGLLLLAGGRSSGAGLAGDGTRMVRVLDAVGTRGEPVEVVVELESAGNENAVGMSLGFDPTALRFVDARAGSAANDAALQVNDRRVAEGCLGVAVAKPVGSAFAEGKAQLLRLTFVPIGFAETCSIEFTDKPVTREIVDAWADVQPATFVGGRILVNLGPRV